ncbi:chitin synthase [Plasmodiophora brassicae]|nr:hypothetical protein PBRA_002459 [Plasmodiophora brassicae]
MVDAVQWLGPNFVMAANGVVSFFLLIAFFHAFSYFTSYCITLFKVVRDGEKAGKHPILTRLTAFLFLIAYMGYNGFVYFVLAQTVNWQGLYLLQKPFLGSIFDHEYVQFLQFEPVVLIALTWFKIGCASDAWRRSPGTKEVTTLLQERAKDRRQGGLPSITVVMPIYNEPIETLMIAINSVVTSKYPKKRLHLVLAFDDDKLTLVYKAVIYCLTSGNPDPDYAKLATDEGQAELGISSNADDYPFIGDIKYRNLIITPCRFEHGGKRHAQMCAFKYLQRTYKSMPTKPLLLFIDSDIELDETAMAHFVYDMNRNKGVTREALTGLITCKTAGTYSFYKLMQDSEYIESQMLQRNTEDYLGAVSCLPGALTMVRFEALEAVAPTYFGKMTAEDNFDFNRTHLGEDRYLTHLLMESRTVKYRIGFCPAARCKTEGCEDFRSLMKQRRRWYLGTLTNEVYMLTSPVLWRHFTGLNVLIALLALKNGPLFVYVFFLEAALGHGTVTTIGFAILIFVPIWFFVSAWAIHINRYKVIFGYPMNILFLPIFSSVFQLYGMLTFKVRSWGGPRQSAAQAVVQVEPKERLTRRRDAQVASAV